MVKAPKSVQVGLNLHFLTISGTWEPNDAERAAAWELYVELVTRISVVLFLSEATVTGQVGLPGAHIGGQLDCDEATINNPGGRWNWSESPSLRRFTCVLPRCREESTSLMLGWAPGTTKRARGQRGRGGCSSRGSSTRRSRCAPFHRRIG
ncbi:MAG: hypothetical protein ACXVHI_01345 [Frankiaceae bacterium]